MLILLLYFGGAIAICLLATLVFYLIYKVSAFRNRKRQFKHREPRYWDDLIVMRDEHMDDIYGEDLSSEREVINN